MTGVFISRSGKPFNRTSLQLFGHLLVQGLHLDAWIAFTQGLKGEEAVILMFMKQVNQSLYI